MATTGQSASKRRAGATLRARDLRRKQTEPERILWNHLRDRRLEGFKFARQVPIGPYVADFACRDRRLIVELDGSGHADSAHDAIRTARLNAHGYSVLRFWNQELLDSPLAVLDMILAALLGTVADRAPDIRFHPSSLHDQIRETAP
ncbi:hypothetical protein A6302_00662 [Methylobrevis pamukkalensis]|uniref:DUF559 domain-containing protein n=2 Tax=Methylobrevis pamukkalensis TaxID=1439726 RepID=A0A1E3H6S8_9HYPH|nr:hypothetical protein A6302_00662 [Methylobrevis pamukkalensis]